MTGGGGMTGGGVGLGLGVSRRGWNDRLRCR